MKRIISIMLLASTAVIIIAFHRTSTNCIPRFKKEAHIFKSNRQKTMYASSLLNTDSRATNFASDNSTIIVSN